MLNITNTLTEHDVARAAAVETTPDLFARAQMAGLEGSEFFARKFVNPVLREASHRNDRERVLVGSFYRLYACCRSLLKLNEAIEGFPSDLEELNQMPVWALGDVALQSLGEPSRYRLDVS